MLAMDPRRFVVRILWATVAVAMVTSAAAYTYVAR
jgi:hypothetical protein